MKLQIASRIAIYAILDLAADPERSRSAAEIADAYNVSIHHLSKVLHTLTRAGLVRSVRGAGGGYVFAANPRRTTLGDVVTLFEPIRGDAVASEIPGSETLAGVALGRVLDEIDEIAEATLYSITVSTMLKLVGRKPEVRTP